MRKKIKLNLVNFQSKTLFFGLNLIRQVKFRTLVNKNDEINHPQKNKVIIL